MRQSKIQKFTVETINRDQIKLAAYNPRLIDPVNKKLLRKGLKEHGLVETLVWNKRTGNLVSGHQRLSIIDGLEKTQNYSLTVSVIDVDERQEKILNVQLNNSSMQGVFDVQMLGDLALDDDISLEELGFTDLDAETMFGGEEKYQSLFSDAPEVSEAKGKLKEFKKVRETLRKDYEKAAAIGDYVVISFSNAEQGKSFREEMGIPEHEHNCSYERLYQWIIDTLSESDEDDEDYDDDAESEEPFDEAEFEDDSDESDEDTPDEDYEGEDFDYEDEELDEDELDEDWQEDSEYAEDEGEENGAESEEDEALSYADSQEDEDYPAEEDDGSQSYSEGD